MNRFLATINFMLENGVKTDQVEIDVKEERLRVCEGCEKFWSKTRQCGVCKCFMDVKAKLVYDPVLSAKNRELEKVKCPEGRW